MEALLGGSSSAHFGVLQTNGAGHDVSWLIGVCLIGTIERSA